MKQKKNKNKDTLNSGKLKLLTGFLPLSMLLLSGCNGENNTPAPAPEPTTPTITISNITGNTQTSMMGSVPIMFTATISESGTSTLTAVLADFNGNPVTGTIISSPDKCVLGTGGITSCTFTIIPWNTGFDNSTAGKTGYTPYTPQPTNIALLATNEAVITGVGVNNNTISYNITTPYVYLAATESGNKDIAGTGITWGDGGTINQRFESGSQNGGGTCIASQKDNLTGLEWLADANQICSSGCPWDSTSVNDSAQRAIADFNTGGGACGYTDWRLPTVNELRSLINYGASQNGSTPESWLNTQGFSNVQADHYWSSTPQANDFAWFVSFGDGLSYYSDIGGNHYVWPVRGGE